MIISYGSPAIVTKEFDFSSFPTPPSTTAGAIVGDFEWGPVFEPVTLTHEGALVTLFGKPNDTNFKDWFSARNFLTYSSNLRAVRCVGAASKNASDVEDEAILIKNASHFTSLYGTLSAKTAKVYARCPGVLGNELRVVISDKDALDTEGNVLAPYVTKDLNDNDVAVGVFRNSEIVEFGMYSFVKDSTDISGYNNYVISAINDNSRFIFLIAETLITYTNEVRNGVDIDIVLKGGVSAEVTTGDYKLGWDLFKNPETEDISLLMQGGAAAEIGGYIIDSVATVRKDCVACVSPQIDDVVGAVDPVTTIVTAAKAFARSSYAFMDGSYKYQYDAYNNTYRWVPMNADSAGLMALTDVEQYPWFSPGNKLVKDCVKLAFYPDKIQRDELYKHGVNIYTSFPESGHVLFSDQTRHEGSLFNFINVRRCFIYMEKAVAKYARNVLFKQNDALTRAQFEQAVDPFLRNVQSLRGISEYKIYCDERVNTPDVVIQGGFVCKIAVKPINSVRFVEITWYATRYDAKFDEIVLPPNAQSL